PATVARLTRAGFDLLAALHPGMREQFVGALTPRLERIQLANIWEQWFGVGSEDSAAVHELQQATTWVTLPAGETLCRPGDPADGMFIVVSGRLEVTTDTDYGTVSYQVGR